MPSSIQAVKGSVIEQAKDAAKDAILNAATNTQLWVSVGIYLYQKMKNPSSLTDDDFDRYLKTCNAYKAMGYEEIPSQWALDSDKRPTHYSDFRTQRNTLEHQLEIFDKCNNNMKTQIMGIVSNLSHLFGSLSKRFNYLGLRQTYRPDGFESMFLNELAMWLIIDLPRYNITEESTADIVETRIEYCKTMLTDVLVFRGDNNISNPRAVLESVIAALKVLKKYLCQAHQAAGFSVTIDAIDNHINVLISDTFNLLHLMLEQGDQYLFQVGEFIGIVEGGRTDKIATLQHYLLSQWIKETCEAADITDNSYVSHKEIPFALIDTHIQLDMSSLEGIEKIGFHDFVWKKDFNCADPLYNDRAQEYLRDEAPAFLEKVIKLHRSILRMSFIRKILKAGTQLTVAYGETWLFGDNAKPLFDGLLAVLVDTIKSHENSLKEFWGSYYTNIYKPYAKKHNKDDKDETYKKMRKAHKFKTQSFLKIEKIAGLIQKIHYHADEVRMGDQSNRERKHYMATQIYAYLSHINEHKKKLGPLREMIAATKTQLTPIAASSPEFSKAQKDAHLSAILFLSERGGYQIKDIPVNLIEDVYQFFMSAADNVSPDEGRAREEKYLLAFFTAQEHAASENSDTAIVRVPRKSSEPDVKKLIFTNVQAKTALKIRNWVCPKPGEVPADLKYSKIADLPPSFIEKLKRSKLHSLIYKEVAVRYSAEAESGWTASLHFYSNDDRQLLQKHYSRLICALGCIAENSDELYKPENQPLIEVINGDLISGLRNMCREMPWIKITSNLMLEITIAEISLIKEIDVNHVQVISPTSIVPENSKSIDEKAKLAQVINNNMKASEENKRRIEENQKIMELRFSKIEKLIPLRQTSVVASNAQQGNINSNRIQVDN